jgi:phage terminase small subunit
MEKELNFQEQAFKALYVESLNATTAARGAGYAESTVKFKAWSWVSLRKCPEHKRHLLKSIKMELGKRFDNSGIDKGWLLTRLALLADFNIDAFIVTDRNGNAVYDFSRATPDDWYCISEYTVDRIHKGRKDDTYDVERTKLKTHCKLKALELIGKHTDVQSFREQVEHSGAVEITLTRTVVDV